MSLNTFKRTEIIQSVFFDHNGTKLEINTRIIMVKSPHTWKLNNTVLNDPYINKEVLAKKKKKTLNQVKIKMQHVRICGTQSSAFMHWNENLYSNKNPRWMFIADFII